MAGNTKQTRFRKNPEKKTLDVSVKTDWQTTEQLKV